MAERSHSRRHLYVRRRTREQFLWLAAETEEMAGEACACTAGFLAGEQEARVIAQFQEQKAVGNISLPVDDIFEIEEGFSLLSAEDLARLVRPVRPVSHVTEKEASTVGVYAGGQ